MKELTLTLSTEDTNLILEGLGSLPFVKVYGLISKIQEQAQHQLSGNGLLNATNSLNDPTPLAQLGQLNQADQAGQAGQADQAGLAETEE